MKNTIWLFKVVLAILIQKVASKVYQNHIALATIPTNRQYSPKHEDEEGGWLIRIVNEYGYFVCGGAYVSPLLVVTSGNCIYPHRESISSLLAETEKMLNNEDTFSEIDNYYLPPEFQAGKNYMDIAVLRLRIPIRGKRTEFIRLCETGIEPNMKLKSYSWSSEKVPYSKEFAAALKKPALTITMDKCSTRWQEKNVVLSNSIFCVHFNKKQRTECPYDPGCPLIYKNELCGIVSGGKCLHPKLPAIYTDINKVKRFILITEGKIRMGLRV